MSRLPKRTRAHVLEEESRQFVEQILPSKWVVESGQKDYGIDLVVEIVRGEYVTGAHFLMQLKATDELAVRKNECIAKACKTSTLRYFLQRPELIVYIIYDAQSRVGYWIWIQDYIRNQLQLDPAWKTQKTATIRIPLENEFGPEAVKEIAQRVLKSHEQAKWLAAIQTVQNPYFDYKIEKVAEQELQIGVFEKYPGALGDRPVTLSGAFKFDQSSEGQAAWQAVEAAIKTGAPAEIDSRFFGGFDIPDFVSGLFAHSEGQFTTSKITIGPVVGDERLIAKISVLDRDNNSLAEIPYVDFQVVQAGTEEITYSNEEQAIPLRIQLRLNLEKKTSSISIQLGDSVGLNVVQIRNFFRIQRALAAGSWFQITDLDTGFSIMRDRIPNEAIPDPEGAWEQIMEGLAFVQERTKNVIRWTGQITQADLQILARIIEVIRNGRLYQEVQALHFPTDKTGAQGLADAFAASEQISLSFHLPENSVRLLGTELPLGPATALFPNLRVGEETLQRLEDLEQLPDDAVLQMRLDVEEPGVVVLYHDWLPTREKAADDESTEDLKE